MFDKQSIEQEFSFVWLVLLFPAIHFLRDLVKSLYGKSDLSSSHASTVNSPRIIFDDSVHEKANNHLKVLSLAKK